MIVSRRPAPRPRYRYVPTAQLGQEPHVVVDGAARPGTVCTLSHWPATPTPRRLWADTSAEIVLRALARPRLLPPGVELATVDHYDADGVIALGLLVDEELASLWGTRLAGAARAGDFDVVRCRQEALVAFALGALADPGGDGACRPDAAVDATAAAAGRALELLAELAAHPEDFEHLWGAEAAAYDRSLAMVEAGAVRIEQRPALDLAVVEVDDRHPDAAAAAWEGAPVHRAAVYSATSCLRVATMAARRYELRFRYESWVRLASFRPRRRVDLGPLAMALSEAESDGGRWEFDGAGAILPALRRVDGAPSTLAPARFLAQVAETLERLDQGPAAWDPYGAAGGR